MKIKSILLALSIVLTFTACGVAQVYNVPHQSITIDNTREADVYKAIVRAGSGLGWNVQRIRSGKAEASLHLRTHVAIVTIDYNSKDYSITYKSSVNLHYDESMNTIHTNYNGWIQNLNKAIQIQLTLL